MSSTARQRLSGSNVAKREKELRVYLVEDSFIMSNLVEDLVTASGATIVGRSGSADVAIREIAALEPDVVVTDLALSDGNGFRVLEATRVLASGKRPTRIVLTNYVSAAYRNAATRFGADGFFEKSKDITKMIGFLARL